MASPTLAYLEDAKRRGAQGYAVIGTCGDPACEVCDHAGGWGELPHVGPHHPTAVHTDPEVAE